jgi:hypothetical protein
VNDRGDPCNRGVRAALAICEIVTTWATWVRLASLSSCAKVKFGLVGFGQVMSG